MSKQRVRGRSMPSLFGVGRLACLLFVFPVHPYSLLSPFPTLELLAEMMVTVKGLSECCVAIWLHPSTSSPAALGLCGRLCTPLPLASHPAVCGTPALPLLVGTRCRNHTYTCALSTLSMLGCSNLILASNRCKRQRQHCCCFTRGPQTGAGQLARGGAWAGLRGLGEGRPRLGAKLGALLATALTHDGKTHLLIRQRAVFSPAQFSFVRG